MTAHHRLIEPLGFFAVLRSAPTAETLQPRLRPPRHGFLAGFSFPEKERKELEGGLSTSFIFLTIIIPKNNYLVKSFPNIFDIFCKNMIIFSLHPFYYYLREFKFCNFFKFSNLSQYFINPQMYRSAIFLIAPSPFVIVCVMECTHRHSIPNRKSKKRKCCFIEIMMSLKIAF